MKQRKGSLPGINNINSGPKSLESLNNVDITRGKSFLPVMQNFGQVMPSRRIIKKDGSYGQVKDFNMPEIREIRKPGFSGNFRTKPYVVFSFNEKAELYFSTLESEGTLLTDAEKILYNQLFLDLNGDGTTGNNVILTKLDSLQVYCGINETASKVDLISNVIVDFNNTYSFTPKIGFAGDGSTGFINTKFNPTTVAGNYQLNSAFTLVAGNLATNGHYVGGARRTSTDQSYIRLGVAGTALDAPINASAGTLSFGTHTGEYYAAINRSDASTTSAYLNGVLTDTNTQASGTLLNATMVVPGFNSFPASPTALNPIALNNRTYRFFATGGSLSDAEHLQLYNSLEKFRTDIQSL